MSPPLGHRPYTPYGPWATLALAAAVGLGAALLAWLLLAAARGGAPGGDVEDLLAGALLAAVLGTAALVKLVEKRAPGRVADYLALRWVDPGVAARWLGATLVYLVAVAIVQSMLRAGLGIEPPPDPIARAPLGLIFLLAVLVAAPVYEELMFRGFVTAGLLGTPLGWSGTLTVTSLAWALLHSQYDTISLIAVFGAGLLFGLARLSTGSLPLAVAMHALFNGATLLLSRL
jgi:membrane protease YdiL (CAAX protease family)